MEEFLFLGLLALFALGSFGALFFYDFVSGSLFLGVWVLLVECGRLNSSGDGFVCGAMLGSTIEKISALPWIRILKCLVFILTQSGEECSADAPVSALDALLAPGHLEILSRV